jgi:hypothetical protein
VRIFELVVAGLFVLGGVRAIWYWSRRPFEGTDVVDHLLYALYLTGRIGLWFAFAGLFLIYASIEVQGRAALDDLEEFRWYLLVPLVLAAMQLLGGCSLVGARPRTRPETYPTALTISGVSSWNPSRCAMRSVLRRSTISRYSCRRPCRS